eukprot:7130630-Prymnesium_polylepis.1
MNPPPGSLQSEVGRSSVSWIGVAATGLIHRSGWIHPERRGRVDQSPVGGLIHVRLDSSRGGRFETRATASVCTSRGNCTARSRGA